MEEARRKGREKEVRGLGRVGEKSDRDTKVL